MNTQLNSKRGFTLIEVILVLAIAALIFLMVFIALPALQSSQRDTSRKNDASIVSSAVTAYTSAYRKPLAATTDQANLRRYVGTLDQYPAANGGNVMVRGAGADTALPAADEVWVRYASKCSGPDAVAGTARQATVRVRLEAGSGTAYCIDAS